jgi:hypothetical protein
MSELIKVDFKAGVVVERIDLEKPVPPEPEWSAVKDPNFKMYIESIVHVAELTHKAGGNWRRMIVTLQPDASDNETCYTIWDQGTLTREQASDCLMLSANRVEASAAEEEAEVKPDATT